MGGAASSVIPRSASLSRNLRNLLGVEVGMKVDVSCPNASARHVYPLVDAGLDEARDQLSSKTVINPVREEEG